MVQSDKAALKVVGDKPSGVLSQYHSGKVQAIAKKKCENRPKRNDSITIKDLLHRDIASYKTVTVDPSADRYATVRHSSNKKNVSSLFVSIPDQKIPDNA